MRYEDPFRNITAMKLSKFGVKMYSELSVPTSNMRLDFLFVMPEVSTIKDCVPYKYMNRYNCSEFKSISDRFDLGDLDILLAKTAAYIAVNHGYQSKNKVKVSRIKFINPEQISLVVMLSGQESIPKKITNNYNVERLEDGIYRIKLTYFKEIIFILIGEMEINKNNYFMSVFTEKKLPEAIKLAYSEKDTYILSIVNILYGRDILLKILGDKMAELSIVERMRKNIGEIIRGWTIEEKIEWLNSLDEDERIKWLNSLDKNEKIKLFNILKKMLNKE